MKLYRKQAVTGLFLVSLISFSLPAFAEESASSTSSIPSTIYQGAMNAWGWGRSTANILSLIGNDKVENLKVPVLGVKVSQLVDTWGDARSNGRSHEGIDIMAARGTPVISPTKAVVSEIGYGALGGNYVYTINPGGERFYYAHLDSYAKDLVKGTILEPGDVIGYVGNTGNASGEAPHLHFGIYQGGAHNPYPRLTQNWSSEEAVTIKKEITGTTTSQVANLPKNILSRNLTLGSTGEDVRVLQKFLNTHGALIAVSGPGSLGNETTYFGPATRNALIVYQRSKGITPLSGYFGPLTRASVTKDSTTLAVAQ